MKSRIFQLVLKDQQEAPSKEELAGFLKEKGWDFFLFEQKKEKIKYLEKLEDLTLGLIFPKPDCPRE